MEFCAGLGNRVRRLTGFGLVFGVLLGAGMLPADAVVVRTVTKPKGSL